MAIEVIPKPKTRKITWSTGLLMFCLVVFLGLGGSLLYFYFSIKNFQQEIEINAGKIRALETSNKPLREELLAYEQKINNFATLLSGHKKIENIFAFLEEKCHPQVRFKTFDWNSKSAELLVSAQAETFVALEQQIIILRAESLITKLSLSGLSLSKEGEINFSLRLTFDPQILK